MEYIVDFQSFKLASNDFAIKELAILKLGSHQPPAVFVFKPPCHWFDLPIRCRVENNWLEKNYLTMAWESVDIGYDKVESVLKTALSDAGKIYVKGLQKVKWLKRYVNNVVDIEAVSKCPSLRALKKWRIPGNLCEHHQ